jgi:hypothetical protein
VGDTAVNPKGGTMSLPNDIDTAAAHLHSTMDNTAGARNGGQLDFLSLQSSSVTNRFTAGVLDFIKPTIKRGQSSLLAISSSPHLISGIRLRYVDHDNNAKALTIVQGKASLAGISK